jgi:integrase
MPNGRMENLTPTCLILPSGLTGSPRRSVRAKYRRLRREIDDWLGALGLSPKSRNNFRANVGVLFSYAVDRGYIERNPIDRTGKAKLVDKAPEIFTVNELTALLTSADSKIVPPLAIGAFAGLRNAEIQRLEWSELISSAVSSRFVRRRQRAQDGDW